MTLEEKAYEYAKYDVNGYIYWTSYTWDLSYNISVPLNSFYY